MGKLMLKVVELDEDGYPCTAHGITLSTTRVLFMDPENFLSWT